MPYSFTEIEKDKTKTIGFVFVFLVFLYFFSVVGVGLILKNAYWLQSLQDTESPYREFVSLAPVEWVVCLLIAMIIGLAHWLWTMDNLLPKIMGVLKAENLNPHDRYHAMLQNIIDEVSVATGGQKIRGVVVATTAMNAFALADFNGNKVIGVTEGLLAKLPRAQIEAVVGHEAAHIVSGDCLGTTMAASIFGIYSGVMEGLEKVLNFDQGSYSRRRSGGVWPLLIFVYIFLAMTKFVSQLIKMFISREREYRADAVAVRLTRDPLALASALYAIAHRWRGGGLASDELEAIFIVNPEFSQLDESEDIFSNLFSTHPPIAKRLDILLNMAHSDVKSLASDVDKIKPKTTVPQVSVSAENWMISKDGHWQGPFGLTDISKSGWMRPDLWVHRIGDKKVALAYEDNLLQPLFSSRGKDTQSNHCPVCKAGLYRLDYEGVGVFKCAICQGSLISENDVQRVIIREEIDFPEHVKKLAEVVKNITKAYLPDNIPTDPNKLLTCPQCQKNKMLNRFYTLAYPVQVSHCFSCRLFWFDRDELELLQYMIEQNTATV